MSEALFRVSMPDGTIRLARGGAVEGPHDLLSPESTLDRVLTGAGDELASCLKQQSRGRVPRDARILAPIEGQEVWAAGVTYLRSREGRMEESSSSASVYDQVYEAARPELFYKAAGWRVRGPDEPVGIRSDSPWNVPEPELALVVSQDGSIVGVTIGNDMSSRSIEAENPLYLPQAKTFDGACALGPGIVPIEAVLWPLTISMEIERDSRIIFRGTTDTDQTRRELPDLVAWLHRALAFPVGAILMTGTGIVPPADVTTVPGDHIRISIDGLGRLENTVELVGSLV